LNNFRYNRPSQRDLDMLNKTCQKFDEVKNCKDYIFITTHNRIVDERNNSELKKLESPTSYFEAEVEGNLPNPSKAKYSHCTGMITESAAARALTVISPNEGEQSIIINS
jgi:hypothetical protein